MDKITTAKIKGSKSQGHKITMLTAYDYPFAKMVDEAGADIILIGDSLGNVALGYQNTLPVTMEEMLIHTRAVARAVKRALIVADMPFGSFQKEAGETVGNAVKLVKAGAEAVKLEGAEYLDTVKQIIKAGIPVMGHLGLTPQSVHQLGGYGKQGKDKRSAGKILKDARALERAGCFALVLELVPDELAKKISRALKIPAISCGAGSFCDGRVVVTYDLLGISDWHPCFVKPKADLRKVALKALKEFVSET
jgi:3-methyl-2-oxobutanoate hydroxymethyltransferase